MGGEIGVAIVVRSSQLVLGVTPSHVVRGPVRRR